MKREILERYKNKKVTLILGNGFKFTNIFLRFEEPGLVSFFDVKENEFIFLEPESIVSVAVKKGEMKNGT